jgi:hypothetical protein
MHRQRTCQPYGWSGGVRTLHGPLLRHCRRQALFSAATPLPSDVYVRPYGSNAHQTSSNLGLHGSDVAQPVAHRASHVALARDARAVNPQLEQLRERQENPIAADRPYGWILKWRESHRGGQWDCLSRDTGLHVCSLQAPEATRHAATRKRGNHCETRADAIHDVVLDNSGHGRKIGWIIRELLCSD